MPTSELVSTAKSKKATVPTHVTYLPNEVDSAREDLASVVAVNQSLQVRQLGRYSSTVGHHQDFLILTDWDRLSIWPTEHDQM